MTRIFKVATEEQMNSVEGGKPTKDSMDLVKEMIKQMEAEIAKKKKPK
jgi:hypothetical protein